MPHWTVLVLERAGEYDTRFEILRHGRKSYRPVEPIDGCQRSEVFARAFRLDEATDPLGNPLDTLLVQ